MIEGWIEPPRTRRPINTSTVLTNTTPSTNPKNLMHMVTVGYTPASDLMLHDAVDDEAGQGSGGGEHEHSDNRGHSGVVNWEDLFGTEMNYDLN